MASVDGSFHGKFQLKRFIAEWKPFDEMAGQLGGRHLAMTCPRL
jgi:hypothetical protein